VIGEQAEPAAVGGKCYAAGCLRLEVGGQRANRKEERGNRK